MSQLRTSGILCLVSFATASVNATEYFVATQAVNASGNNPGTHRAPFKTITKACEAAQAGDVVTRSLGDRPLTIAPWQSSGKSTQVDFMGINSCMSLVFIKSADGCWRFFEHGGACMHWISNEIATHFENITKR